jgi:hypothetical protein
MFESPTYKMIIGEWILDNIVLVGVILFVGYVIFRWMNRTSPR